MPAGPTAIVTQLIDFENDPNNANNTLISWQFQLLVLRSRTARGARPGISGQLVDEGPGESGDQQHDDRVGARQRLHLDDEPDLHDRRLRRIIAVVRGGCYSLRMAGPVAIVTEIIGFSVDPNNASNVLLDWEFQLLFCGPDPLQEQGQISIADTSTKAQIKSAVNAVMVASAAAKGFTLPVSRIFTIADIAG